LYGVAATHRGAQQYRETVKFSECEETATADSSDESDDSGTASRGQCRVFVPPSLFTRYMYHYLPGTCTIIGAKIHVTNTLDSFPSLIVCLTLFLPLSFLAVYRFIDTDDLAVSAELVPSAVELYADDGVEEDAEGDDYDRGYFINP